MNFSDWLMYQEDIAITYDPNIKAEYDIRFQFTNKLLRAKMAHDATFQEFFNASIVAEMLPAMPTDIEICNLIAKEILDNRLLIIQETCRPLS